jgi:hypothetical protein
MARKKKDPTPVLPELDANRHHDTRKNIPTEERAAFCRASSTTSTRWSSTVRSSFTSTISQSANGSARPNEPPGDESRGAVMACSTSPCLFGWVKNPDLTS